MVTNREENSAENKIGPTNTKEMAVLINPTTIPIGQGTAIATVEENVVVEKQDDLDSASIDSLERENNLIQAIRTTLLPNPDKSVLGLADNRKNISQIKDSFLMSESVWEENLAYSDITHEDGRLNREKMAGWTIPTAKKSISLEKSLMELKEGKDHTSTRDDKGPHHSTPVITKVAKKYRRGKRSKQRKELGLRDRTLKMLDEMDL